MDQSGDVNFRNGANSPLYCAILTNCLPTVVAEANKTNNMDWSENSPSQMAHLGIIGDTKKSESQPPANVKTEYVVKREILKAVPDTTSHAVEPRCYVPDWAERPNRGHRSPLDGLYAPSYSEPYAPPRPYFRVIRATEMDCCFTCGGLGHWSRHCLMKRQEGGGYRQEQRGDWQGMEDNGSRQPFTRIICFPTDWPI